MDIIGIAIMSIKKNFWIFGFHLLILKTKTPYGLRQKNKKNFRPCNVKWGQILIFDSSLLHGVEVNKEKYTRASMDFRIILKKDYKKWNKTSPKKKNIKFELGGYYTKF